MGDRPEKNEWFRDWFDETYLELYASHDLAEARLIVDWIAKSFLPRTEGLVVDLGCGAGRHTWVMAREKGWNVLGIDLSQSLLHHACEITRAHFDERPVPSEFRSRRLPRFVRADLRRLPLSPGCCNLALSLFTSFGYFEDDHAHRDSIRGIAEILAENGILLLDLANQDPVITNLSTDISGERSSRRIVQKRSWLPDRKRIVKDIEIFEGDHCIRRVCESVRLFTAVELSGLLETGGLVPEGIIGDYSGNPYLEDSSPRMILWARKRNP